MITLCSFQVEDGDDYRVLISPLPPKKEEKVVVKTEKKVVEKKVEKKVVKVEVKKGDNRLENLSTHVNISIFQLFLTPYSYCYLSDDFTYRHDNDLILKGHIHIKYKLAFNCRFRAYLNLSF